MARTYEKGRVRKGIAMLAQKTDSKQKNRNERAKQAIALALEGKWAAAVESNRRFVADFPR